MNHNKEAKLDLLKQYGAILSGMISKQHKILKDFERKKEYNIELFKGDAEDQEIISRVNERIKKEPNNVELRNILELLNNRRTRNRLEFIREHKAMDIKGKKLVNWLTVLQKEQGQTRSEIKKLAAENASIA